MHMEAHQISARIHQRGYQARKILCSCGKWFVNEKERLNHTENSPSHKRLLQKDITGSSGVIPSNAIEEANPMPIAEAKELKGGNGQADVEVKVRLSTKSVLLKRNTH